MQYEILREKYVNMQLLKDKSICMIKPIILSCLGAEPVLFCAIALHQNNGD